MNNTNQLVERLNALCALVQVLHTEIKATENGRIDTRMLTNKMMHLTNLALAFDEEVHGLKAVRHLLNPQVLIEVSKANEALMEVATILRNHALAGVAKAAEDMFAHHVEEVIVMNVFSGDAAHRTPPEMLN